MKNVMTCPVCGDNSVIDGHCYAGNHEAFAVAKGLSRDRQVFAEKQEYKVIVGGGAVSVFA